MGESSVYYVPDCQDAWSGRGEELADLLWNFGIFLDTPKTMDRLRAFRDESRPIPECNLDINQKFGGMGVSDESEDHPVPNHLYEITCSNCGHNVMDAAYDIWATESDIVLKDRTIICPSCNATSATGDLRYGEAMSFARFYVWVSDCDQENWDPNSRKILEQLIGPCQEYWEWST